MPQAASASHSVEQTLEAAATSGDTSQLAAAIRAAVQALACGSLSSARMTEVRDCYLRSPYCLLLMNAGEGSRVIPSAKAN